MRTGEKIVRNGSFEYGSVRLPLRIVQTDLRPGTGDTEDEPEWRDDQVGTFFYVEYASGSEQAFIAQSSRHNSLEGALQEAAACVGGLAWND